MTSPTSGIGGAICVVEPDHAVRDGLASFIGLYNHPVRGFSDSGDLRRAWPALHAVGVLCAVRLPDASAVDLYYWLLNEGMDVPFAVTVSTHQRREITAAAEAGISHILHKPLLPGTALIRFLDHTRATASDASLRKPI